MVQKTMWAALWQSCNKLDGKSKHLIHESCVPRLFRTRREAREYVRTHFGYIAERADLRGEPHGWKMPNVVKVIISTTDS